MLGPFNGPFMTHLYDQNRLPRSEYRKPSAPSPRHFGKSDTQARPPSEYAAAQGRRGAQNMEIRERISCRHHICFQIARGRPDAVALLPGNTRRAFCCRRHCGRQMDRKSVHDAIAADSRFGTRERIPAAINVLGSRYALVIGSLRKADFDLPLNQTAVAVGRCRGVSGARYISGRVDKACLEITERAVT
jgi:hypothetical protein